MGEMQGMKVKRIQELAMDAGVPLVGMNDSGGGRIRKDQRPPTARSFITT